MTDDIERVTAVSFAISALLRGCEDELDFDNCVMATAIGLAIYAEPEDRDGDDEFFVEVQEAIRAALINRRLSIEAQQAMAEKIHHTEQ